MKIRIARKFHLGLNNIRSKRLRMGGNSLDLYTHTHHIWIKSESIQSFTRQFSFRSIERLEKKKTMIMTDP